MIEVRMDSAFFSDEIIEALVDRGVEFTLSVPFERFAELKRMIEQRRRWHRLNSEAGYFESTWKPQCWDTRFRFILIRTKSRKQQKSPVQLDLFVPYEYGYEFKVIVTNKTMRPWPRQTHIRLFVLAVGVSWLPHTSYAATMLQLWPMCVIDCAYHISQVKSRPCSPAPERLLRCKWPG